MGGLQGLHRGQSSIAFLEQITESPDPSGDLQDFQPVQGSAASSSVSPGHAGECFFRTFHRSKKSPTSTASPSARVHAHSISSTHDGAVPRGDLWVQIMTDDDPCFWHRQEQTFCRRYRARSDLYHGAGKVWTVHELACFLSPFDVVVSVNMRHKFQQSLPICGWCLFFSSSTEWWILP